MKIKSLIKYASIIALMLITFIFYCHCYIKKSSLGKLFNDIEKLPKNKVGLLLGTSKHTHNGYLNYYYKHRVDATLKLYSSGKIDYVIISGDNSKKDYDEPTQFKNDLMAYGIPENKIFLDYAGFRTLDSVIRAKEIFGQTNITIISQKFHNQRAIFLANNHGINAVGYNAKDVSSYYGVKTNLREYLAKTKAVIDIMFNTSPKYLGEKIEIK